jgi:hypothetical protein
VEAWLRQYLYQLKWLYLKFIAPFIQVEIVEIVEAF